MTAMDIIVLALLGGGGILGFKNGFVQEVLSFAAWAVAIIAIRLFHDPVSLWLVEPVGSEGGAATLALIGIFAVSFFAVRWGAAYIGGRMRRSTLGPLDRVLGFGFGALKGLIAATLLFLLATMVYEVIWPEDERPEWMTSSRTYPLLNASGNALVDAIEERRKGLEEAD